MKAQPKVLLLALERYWPPPARLPRALQQAGFEVGVVCHPQAFLARSKFRDYLFLLNGKNHGRGILAALKTIYSAWTPDLILPTDEDAALFLAQAQVALPQGGLADLLLRSSGPPQAVRDASSKRRTIEIARSLGIRVPTSQTVENAAEAVGFARSHGFPVVLKNSYSNGGYGVAVCHDEYEIKNHLAGLRREQKIFSRLKIWRERVRGRRMERRWLPIDQTVTANQFIAGRCATSLAAADRGQMRAALTAEVVETYIGPYGPASVIRIRHHAEMRRVTEMMVRQGNFSGMIGFDFILDAENHAWLLECNPRPTPLAHLGGLVEENLCAALRAGLTGENFKPEKSPHGELLVAHFPGEVWRDPASPYLSSAFHDVPQDDPELLQAIKNHPAPRR